MSTSENLRGSVAAIVALFFASAALAGSPSKPYLVWANLHEASRPNITATVKGYIDSLPGDEFCEESALGWIVYIRFRPPGLPNSLVRKALDGRGKESRRTVARNLQAFRDAPDINDGLDGIVAYSEAGKPHMVSIDAHGKIARSPAIHDPGDAKQVIDAFCSVMPNVYRK